MSSDAKRELIKEYLLVLLNAKRERGSMTEPTLKSCLVYPDLERNDRAEFLVQEK